MQCSAWRPTSSASTSVRPPSSRIRWNSCGPSPSRTPVHSDVYGFIRSAVEERGQQLQEHLEVAPLRQHLLDPHQRHQHASAASGTCARCPRTRRRRSCRSRRSPKFAPETATGTERNFARRCRRAASAIAVASLPSELALGDRALEQRADLGAVAVDRRDEDVRLLVVGPSWTISSARSVSSAWMPSASSASFIPISSVASDLTLITSSVPCARAMPRDDRVRLGAVARPVHDAARARSPPPPAARAARAASPSCAP